MEEEFKPIKLLLHTSFKKNLAVKMNKIEKIFHSCFTKNKDGTNRLIKKGERCLVPTSNPFWKFPEDIESYSVRTRSQEKNQANVTRRAYNKYFKQKYIQRWLEAEDSELAFFKRIRYFLRYTLMIGALILVMIVINGNILTDGCRYRNRPPKIEM